MPRTAGRTVSCVITGPCGCLVVLAFLWVIAVGVSTILGHL